MGGADGFDAVVVGSGPNGLIGAVTLARGGLRVLLVEGADEFGGGLRSGALTGVDGFTHDLCATVLPLARASAAFRDLDLDVEWAFPEVQAAHPLDGEAAVLIHRDVARTAEGLESRRDAAAWRHTVGATASGGFGLIDSLLTPLWLPRAPIAGVLISHVDAGERQTYVVDDIVELIGRDRAADRVFDEIEQASGLLDASTRLSTHVHQDLAGIYCRKKLPPRNGHNPKDTMTQARKPAMNRRGEASASDNSDR